MFKRIIKLLRPVLRKSQKSAEEKQNREPFGYKMKNPIHGSSTVSKDKFNVEHRLYNAEIADNKSMGILKEETDKNGELVQRLPVGEGMLEIVGNPERGYALMAGRYRVTEWKPSMEDVERYMIDYKWDTIARLIAAMLSINEDTKSKDFAEYVGKPDFPEIKTEQ